MRLRRAVDPGAAASPAGLTERARPRPDLKHAANLALDGRGYSEVCEAVFPQVERLQYKP